MSWPGGNLEPFSLPGMKEAWGGLWVLVVQLLCLIFLEDWWGSLSQG